MNCNIDPKDPLAFTAADLSDSIIKRISGISYRQNPHISLHDLQYLTLLHVDFCGQTHSGEMICSRLISNALLAIFRQLYEAEYPIARIKLIDDYMGDDDRSMCANNSSCFNYRTIAGTDRLSNHSYGLAVDINPLYNPYITAINGQKTILPENAAPFTDRSLDFPGKIDESDLCFRLFTQYGFSWGGHWTHAKDYQHFDIDPDTALHPFS